MRLSVIPAAVAKIARRICAILASITLSAMALVMFADVVARYVFNHPIPGTAELVEIFVATTVFAALPLVTAGKEHIRLDYLDMALGDTGRRRVRAVGWAVSAVVLAVLSWRVSLTTANVMYYGDTSAYLKIPIAPFGVFITLSLIASTFAMACLVWAELRPGTETDPQEAET